MKNKTNSIFKAISLIFIIIMMIGCGNDSKKEIIKEFENNNVLIHKKDFDTWFSTRTRDDESVELTNLKLRTKFKTWFAALYFSPTQYIYQEFIPLYVLKEYIYNKSIGNNFEEIENTINQFLVDSTEKFNLEKWDKPDLFIPYMGVTNKERNKVAIYKGCYLKTNGQFEEVEEEICSDLEYDDFEQENEPLVKEVIAKYISTKTRYDELNFFEYFEEYNKEPLVVIYLYNPNIKNEKLFKEVVDLFEKGGYLEKIRKNYNNDKIIIEIGIFGEEMSKIFV